MKISFTSTFCLVPAIAGIFLGCSPSGISAEAPVSIVDFAFNPSSLNIQVNDAVVWTWVGPTPHTSTSVGGLWDSGLMSSAAPQFKNTFRSSGTFPYFCSLHPFMTGSVVVNPAPPAGADLSLTLTGTPGQVAVSNEVTYTLLVNNSGPSDAAGPIVTDTFPGDAVFVRSSTTQGTSVQNGAAFTWNVGPLAAGGSASATLVILPLSAATLTNNASVTLNDPLLADPNAGNNGATTLTSVGSTEPGPATNLVVQVLGGLLLNRQTGLFEQPVRLTNLGTNSVAGIRLSVLGLAPPVFLYNASGISAGAPFVEYDQPIDSNTSVDFMLEYYTSNRLDFISTNFAAAVIAPVTPTLASGKVLQLDRQPFLSHGILVIEFASSPGRTYVVEYSPNSQTWSAAVPPIIAAGTRVQWIDAGPPKTTSMPGAVGSRFYRVVELP